MTRLQAEDGGPMDIGGATLAAAAMRAELIDEYASVAHPVLAGAARRSSPPWTPGRTYPIPTSCLARQLPGAGHHRPNGPCPTALSPNGRIDRFHRILADGWAFHRMAGQYA
jgi:hypothetical protein